MYGREKNFSPCPFPGRATFVLFARSLLQQVDDGMVIMLRGKGHAHLAGDVGGIVSVIWMGIDLGAFQGGGRGGQLREEQPSVTRERATVQVERYRHVFCTTFGNGNHFVLL